MAGGMWLRTVIAVLLVVLLVVAVNLRVSKTFGFGPERGTGGNPGGSTDGQGGGGGRNNAPPTAHRYNLSVSMSGRNVLNHTNPGPIIGNITSPLFGRANQMAGGVGGGGFSENADNRRLEMQLRLAF
jgi:hypothetical protein